MVADLSAAYTPNAGPMDAVVKVQLKHEREHSAQEYVQRLRTGLARDSKFRDLEFAFDAGGMIRSAMNEGKSSPINIRISGKNLAQARAIAEAIKREVVADRRAWSTPGSSSGSTIPSTSSRSIAPRWPTSG